MKWLTCLLFIVAGCSPQITVYTDHDPDYKVNYFKTYSWSMTSNIESSGNPLYYNELNDKRIRASVEEQLNKRGYILEKSKPDLLIHYHILVDEATIITQNPNHHYTPYWTRSHVSIYAYEKGTLIIDLLDSKTKNLVWRGCAIAALDDIYNAQQTENLIARAITKIFKNFPPTNKEIIINPGITLKYNPSNYYNE